MAYIRRDYYIGLYGEIPEADFARFLWEAERYVDIHTTGIDNVKKLRRFFPQDEDDAEAVKRCVASILSFLHNVAQVEAAALAVSGYEYTEEGMRGKIISSMTAGNESISFSAGGNAAATSFDAAAKDKSVRDGMVGNIIWQYLSGASDANGVNLLYMGVYPRRYLC